MNYFRIRHHFFNFRLNSETKRDREKQIAPLLVYLKKKSRIGYQISYTSKVVVLKLEN